MKLYEIMDMSHMSQSPTSIKRRAEREGYINDPSRWIWDDVRRCYVYMKRGRIQVFPNRREAEQTAMYVRGDVEIIPLTLSDDRPIRGQAELKQPTNKWLVIKK